MTNTLNKIMHNGDEYLIPQQKALVLTLESANWSADEQTVTATWVTANNSVIVSPAPSSITDYTDWWVYCSGQSTDSLTFACSDTPSNDIDVNVVVLSAEVESWPTPPEPPKTWVLDDVTLEKTFDIGNSWRAGQCISRDGLTLYWTYDNVVYWRTLTTAWDVSTATWWWNTTVSWVDWNQNIWFAPDMKTMFAFNYWSNGSVSKITLSSAWDITTATLTQQVTINHSSNPPTWWILTDDWLYMYICYQDNYVWVWSLSTAFDLSTATLSSSTTAPAWITRWLWISSDYKHLYWWADGKIRQIDMATANDLNNVTTQNRTMPNSPAQFYYGWWLANNNNLLVTCDGRYIRTWNVV